MAKLKFNNAALEVQLSDEDTHHDVELYKNKSKDILVDSDEFIKTSEEVMEEHSDLLDQLNLSNLNDDMSELKQNVAVSEERHQKDMNDLTKSLSRCSSKSCECSDPRVDELERKVEGLSRPIVKEIKLDKTGHDDLDNLEKSIEKTVNKLNNDRKNDNRALIRMVFAGNRLQSAINFLLLVGIALLTYLK